MPPLVGFDQIRRLYPAAFLYDGKPEDGRSNKIHEDEQFRFFKLPIKRRTSKTFITSHNFYSDEIEDVKAGKHVPVDYPIPPTTPGYVTSPKVSDVFLGLADGTRSFSNQRCN